MWAGLKKARSSTTAKEVQKLQVESRDAQVENERIKQELRLSRKEIESMKRELCFFQEEKKIAEKDFEARKLENQTADALKLFEQLSFGLDAGPAAGNQREETKIKEELKSVKEQLIKTEKKMKDQEDTYQEYVSKLKEQLHQTFEAHLKDKQEFNQILRYKQVESRDAESKNERITEELQSTQHELALIKEELNLLRDDMQIAEKDFKDVKQEFAEEQRKSQESVYHLTLQVREKDVKLKEAIDEGAQWVQSAKKAQQEANAMVQELTNTKNDYQKVRYELDGLRARPDELVQTAGSGTRSVMDEIRDAVKEKAHENELKILQQTVDKVIENNNLLQYALQRVCKRCVELEEFAPKSNKRMKIECPS